MVYALLHATGGWLVNLVVWDGNTATWSPPAGTIAVPVGEVDFDTLPAAPADPQYPPDEPAPPDPSQ